MLIASRHPVIFIDKQLVYYREHSGQGTEDQRSEKTEWMRLKDHRQAIYYGASLRPDCLDLNNSILIEKYKDYEIKQEELIGKSGFRLSPSLGWVKLIFYEPLRSKSERGFCDEN